MSSFPSIPSLPDPLETLEGEKVNSREDWEDRREELKELFQNYVFGHLPPPPEEMEVKVLNEETHRQRKAISREVQFAFGPEKEAKLWCELLIPQKEKEKRGKLPVFLTQHNHRPWALLALSRGYVGCIYAGSDSRDDTDSFLEAYPDYDWSRLARRAWAAGRCIDYLEGVDFADTGKVVLTGHSRNGKQSLIASAMDERIEAVISSSSGAGGSLPYRYFSELQFGEGIELLTRVFPDWFHPKLRLFAGSEDRLPVDNNELVALSAPRACLLSTALNDAVESTWGIQQTYLSAKRVYGMLEAEEKLDLIWRSGSHETSPTIIGRYLDWCDEQFGRKEFQQFGSEERFVYPCSIEEWRKRKGAKEETLASLTDLPKPLSSITSREEWEKERENIGERVRAVMGEEPSAVEDRGTYGVEPDHVAQLLRREDPGSGLEKEQLTFGDYVSADIYFPADFQKEGEDPLSALLWLHPFSTSNGYVAGYSRGEQFFRRAARAGFAVFCFDQIGCGRRVQEAEGFYERYPNWSLLGKMVRDSRAALGVLKSLSWVDGERIYAVGYGLGGTIGLHLAPFEERLAGLVSVCGFTPFNPEESNKKGLDPLGRLSERYMLLPRLSQIGPEEVPYDFDQLLACLAPKDLTVVDPRLDRQADAAAVKRSVDSAARIYQLFDAAGKLVHERPDTYNQFGPEVEEVVLDELEKMF